MSNLKRVHQNSGFDAPAYLQNVGVVIGYLRCLRVLGLPVNSS